MIVYESDILEPYLSGTPWSGHRDFAYDLISKVKPELVVELGTHMGCSFMSFCQSVKDHELNTKLVAVDTWLGDAQAGFYGEDIFSNLNKNISTNFSMLNVELKRMLFSEALSSFENESIDILHIDGLHNYKNVSEDFYSYLPKMKKDGIVMFHDVAEYTGYETAQFWKEIKTQYTNYIEFGKSWGLGVIFLGKVEMWKTLY